MHDVDRHAAVAKLDIFSNVLVYRGLLYPVLVVHRKQPFFAKFPVRRVQEIGQHRVIGGTLQSKRDGTRKEFSAEVLIGEKVFHAAAARLFQLKTYEGTADTAFVDAPRFDWLGVLVIVQNASAHFVDAAKI